LVTLLHPGSIVPIFKRVAQWIGMPARFVAEASRHSTRVGAAQDLVMIDFDLAAITQAGGTEVDADAAAICREDQCGEVGNGESGEGASEGRRLASGSRILRRTPGIQETFILGASS
jgi:hypothetical protein